jgi:uncharacterized LabA/DUF88 family protein
MSKRAIIFIDGSNLFHATRNFRPDFQIDFVKLCKALGKDLELIRPYYYGSFDPTNPKQQKFHDWLASNGFEVVIKPLRERDGRKVEKGADVGLVTDLISLGIELLTTLPLLSAATPIL